MPIASVEQVEAAILELVPQSGDIGLRILMSMVRHRLYEENLLLTNDAWDRAQEKILVLAPRANRVSLKNEQK
jgi:hypothetical protein